MDYFIDNVKKYADFTGRSRRTEYWMYYLFYIIFVIVLAVIGAFTGADFLSTIYIFALFLPTISIAARRLHDTGRSGWWQLVGLIPVIGWLIMIYFLVQDSEDDNKWGPNPKAGINA